MLSRHVLLRNLLLSFLILWEGFDAQAEDSNSNADVQSLDTTTTDNIVTDDGSGPKFSEEESFQNVMRPDTYSRGIVLAMPCSIQPYSEASLTNEPVIFPKITLMRLMFGILYVTIHGILLIWSVSQTPCPWTRVVVIVTEISRISSLTTGSVKSSAEDDVGPT
ncbi:unnamed protein product [Allacma fusca]|uniref:Uncharacterized protein n=1 Tax=Allacma fusca TaxID=39272 RepID=A0A8J2P1P5_9HEXA|nr:unnamed protein product [Allacma fusca]